LIGDALTYVRDKVNTHLQHGNTGSEPPLVVFTAGDNTDSLNIQSMRINLLVVNVEEERELRRANPYYDERSQRINPDIPLTLSVLFIARFNDYPTSWNYLTDIIRFFQSNPVLDQLPAGIESLRCELISLDFQQQNEVWGALRITQHPALLYKIKLITLRDQQPQPSEKPPERIVVKLMDKERVEIIDKNGLAQVDQNKIRNLFPNLLTSETQAKPEAATESDQPDPPQIEIQYPDPDTKIDST
jgi:hypothetical protein